MTAKRPFRLPDYKTYSGERGSPNQWRTAFFARMGVEAAREKLGRDSPYSILGVEPGSDWLAIKKAYRKLALQHHPDRGGDPELFLKIQAAFEILEHNYGA